MTVGLIGYGRFGALAAGFLRQKADLRVYDPRMASATRPGSGIHAASLQDAARQEVVILAVPVSALRGVLKDIRRVVRPGALVVDVCAVKALPLRWMTGMLPDAVHVVGTHPLFGPDSAGKTLEGLPIVVCRGRISRSPFQSFKAALQSEGLAVQEMTPEEHDAMVAETVFLTQYVGRLVGIAAPAKHEHASLHYDRLRTIVSVAEHDSFQLFEDMWRFNPRARDIERRLRRAGVRLSAILKGHGKQGSHD